MCGGHLLTLVKVCGKFCILTLRKHVRAITAIFHGCKKDNFQMKNCDVFLIFAQNIDRGYKLEPPH